MIKRKCKGHFRTAMIIGKSKTRRNIYDQPSIVFIKNCEWCNKPKANVEVDKE